MRAVRLKSGDRRAIALGVVVVGGSLLTFRVLPALQHAEGHWRARAEVAESRSAESRATLVRLRSTGGAGSAAEDRVESLAFIATTHTAAAAAAIEYVTAIAETVGAQVSSASLGTRDPGRLDGTGVLVQLSMSGSADALRRFLVQVEAGPKLLVTRTLAVVAGAPTERADAPEVLRIQLAVEALVWVTGEEAE